MNLICRRFRISEEKLRRKLRKMHSLLRISESDSNILTYHRSLHDFFQDKKRSREYHIHPLRIALVRLPQKVGPIGKQVGMVVLGLLLAARMLMCPLFVIPGIFYANRHDGFSLDHFRDFILWYPFH